MKKTLTLTFLFAFIVNNLTLLAQAGYIHTVAGGGTSTVNGIPATSASLTVPASVGVDAVGNVYFVENGGYRIRKVNAVTSLISTVAGNGTSGFSGDGGPATNAQITSAGDIFVDPTGNIYIADGDNNRIRKVDAATGYIHTVAGGGTLFMDGIPATDANIGGQNGIFVDAFGSIFCWGEEGRLKRISAATGIITTLAGGGFSWADGVPATSASLPAGSQIYLDALGNIYLMGMYKIRKIDVTTGMINTIAGDAGAGGSYAEGIPATDAYFLSVTAFAVDMGGNLYTNHGWPGHKIRRTDALTGIINTIAGGGGTSADGVAAFSADINAVRICLDALHETIYYSDWDGRIRKFNYSMIAGGISSSPTGSFYVNTNKLCNGPEIKVVTPTFIAGRSIKTYFGDGFTDSSVITSGFIGGHTSIGHTYSSAGVYTIKHVLFDGPLRVDSFSSSYTYTFCRSLPVNLYFDDNANCTKDAFEHYSFKPVQIEVDSNGVFIKTISATSGFSYNAYSLPGDVYKFKVISSDSGLSVSCPTTGVISDTVFSSVPSYPDKYFGLSCGTSAMFDHSLHAFVIGSGVHQQEGNIYVNNNFCLASDATVTLHHSTKYRGYGSGTILSPTPMAYSDSTIIWHLTGLSAEMAAPIGLHYRLTNNPTTGLLSIGDTVHSYYTVTPLSGDADPSNNSETRIDTVKAGFDPNEILVSPANCLTIGSAPDTLQYTIHFENTGNDTAHNIYVMDTLSANIDPSSVRIIMSSATMNIQMLKDYGYNIVRFDFPKINLLDSSHHGLCDGAVIFSAVTRPGLAYGTQISNRAGIYFDINPVVMTNTVQNIKGCPAAGIEPVNRQHSVLLYPNPAADELTIKTQQTTYTSFTISNSMGQVVLQNDMTGRQAKVDVKALSPGLYFVTLSGAEGNEVQKFLKW